MVPFQAGKMRQFINARIMPWEGMISFTYFRGSKPNGSHQGRWPIDLVVLSWNESLLSNQSHRKWNICALLQRVECANPISLWQAIVFAAMDDKLRRRPLVHKVDRVVFFEHFPGFPIPRTATPFMVELYSWFNQGSSERMSDGVTQRKAHRWSSHCKSRQRRHRGTRGPWNWNRTRDDLGSS